MDYMSFVIYCVIITFTPGPTNVVILSTVNNFGVKRAMEYTYGATIAFGILLGLSSVMNTLLVAVVPKLLVIMQMVGGVYILYLAYQLYKADVSNENEKQAVTFKSGLIMQFVNPKVVLFTMTVFPSFVLPYYSEPLLLAMHVILITVIGFFAFVTWVFFGAVLKNYFLKYHRLTNICMSLFLVYSAIIISGVGEIIRR